MIEHFPAWVTAAVLFGGFIILIALGLPMAFALGSIGIVAGFLFIGPGVLNLAASSTYSVMLNILLIALPLFIFLASILEKSGIAEALYTAMHQWFGPLRGGLAMATVLICTIIAAMSGVSTAGVVTMGLIALPIMLKKGYNKSIAIGPILAGGVLGILIPPSVSFIIYGMITKTSIGRLFAGGLIPGLILATEYIAYIGIRCFLQPRLGPSLPKEERLPVKQKIVLSRGLILPILVILSILGSIFAGVASPTEAAAVGALGALVSAAINRRLTWKVVKEAAYSTITVTGLVMWILFGAYCFSTVFIATGGPQVIEQFVLGLQVAPMVIILMMMISYFILGCFMDEVTIMLLTIPIYMPILLALGFDKVWFGVLFVVNMQMAYLTPPFGYTLFYMRGVAPPEVSLTDIYRSIIPFVCLQWIGVLLVMFFPQLALWLPNQVFKLL